MIRTTLTGLFTILFAVTCEAEFPDLSSQARNIRQGGSSYAGPGGGANRADLRVLMRTSKQVYKNNESIFVDFRLLNAGAKPVTVYNELGKEGWLVVFRLIDRKTKTESWRTPLPKVSARRKSDSLYATLAPECTVGRYFTLNQNGRPFPPGEYLLEAGYTNSYETCLASLYFSDEEIASLGRKAYVRLWTGQIVSAPVPVTIVGQQVAPVKKKKTKKSSRDKR